MITATMCIRIGVLVPRDVSPAHQDGNLVFAACCGLGSASIFHLHWRCKVFLHTVCMLKLGIHFKHLLIMLVCEMELGSNSCALLEIFLFLFVF